MFPWLKSSCCIAGSVFCLSLANAVSKGSELDERQIDLLKEFVGADGAKPDLIKGFENDAVRAVIGQLKTESDVHKQWNLLFALKHSFEQIKGIDPQLVTAGEGVIYEKLKADAPEVRQLAAGIVAVRNKDAALDRLAPLLNDPNEAVRVTVVTLFGSFGNEARIAQLEAFLTRRAKGLTADGIKRDYVFRRGYAAIEKLKQRWHQPAGGK